MFINSYFSTFKSIRCRFIAKGTATLWSKILFIVSLQAPPLFWTVSCFEADSLNLNEMLQTQPLSSFQSGLF